MWVTSKTVAKYIRVLRIVSALSLWNISVRNQKFIEKWEMYFRFSFPFSRRILFLLFYQSKYS